MAQTFTAVYSDRGGFANLHTVDFLVDPAVYAGGGMPAWIRPLLATPQLRHLGPLLVRQIQKRGPEMVKQAWHDPSKLPPETLELYKKPLMVENWDKALWEFNLASHASDLADHLVEFDFPILVITGDDDRIVPTADSIRLAGELPNAELVVIPAAGHVPHEEQPQSLWMQSKIFSTFTGEEDAKMR
jgi:pimeloyl-ACP methyl ester carboxylesterase